MGTALTPWLRTGRNGATLHKAHIDTSFARAYPIPSEHHVAVPAQ
jgi:hypothetical protein